MPPTDEIQVEQIINALKKLPLARSYDDLLLLKAYISKTEFITKDLAGVVNPRQMNEICRSLGLESFSTDDIIFNQGDTGEKVYIILSGKCQVRIRYRLDLTQGESEIREKIAGTLISGSYFGERALKFDEPRSASVVCIEKCYLMTLHKSYYCEVLEEAKFENHLPSLRPEQFGTKEGVIKILSKVREKRTPQELDGVASYLYRRIPFFQKFSMPHLIELCRVADSITIRGRSILFKQGQIGQAFYVILTGTVEVWVHDSQNTPSHTARSTSTAASAIVKNLRSQDLTEGLGAKVNQLVTGDVFGERALENETSQRMASIITGEDNTELIVISKEDYLHLVYVMMHSDSMHKLQLLRRTELFHSLDIVHLRALTRFMEPRKYQIDEEIQITGKKATELIILEKGECRVIVEIQEGYEKLSTEQKYKLSHKRYMEQTTATAVLTSEESATTTTAVSPSADLLQLLTPRHQPKKKQLQFNSQIPFGINEEDIKEGNVGSKSMEGTKPGDIPEIHKLLRHSVDQDENEELLDLSTKEIRKRSLLFAEKLKESMQIATNAATTISRPGSKALPGRAQSPLLEGPSNSEDDGEINRNNAPFVANTSPSRKQNRFRSVDMNLIGKRKKVDLGRIAPNSILASAVLSVENPHSDVYHMETIVAGSLVTAYTVGKHDFFNHMPKDSLEAIIKVIREYKPPILNPLWENAPRILDENIWKMEKAWERYKNQVGKDPAKDISILDSMKMIQRRHISMSSGNDPSTKNQFVSRLDDMLGKNGGSDDKYTRGTGGKMQHPTVDMSWGLAEREKIEEEHPFYLNKHTRSTSLIVVDNQLVTRLPFNSDQLCTSHPKVHLQPLQTTGSGRAGSPIDKKGRGKGGNVNNTSDGSLQPVIPSTAMQNTVSKIIRNRINSSNASIAENMKYSLVAAMNSANSGSYWDDEQGDPLNDESINLNPFAEINQQRSQHAPLPITLKTYQSAASHFSSPNSSPSPSASPSRRGIRSMMRPGTQSRRKLKYTLSRDPLANAVDNAFALIHIHRELPSSTSSAVSASQSLLQQSFGVTNSTGNTAVSTADKKKLLKSYFRIHGTFNSSAKTKQMADTLMEQLYLALFQAIKQPIESELLLQWTVFKGYDSIPSDDTDIFFIYCHSLPVEYATIKPSKNIFNVKFPALCRPLNQRYAVIVVNEVIEVKGLIKRKVSSEMKEIGETGVVNASPTRKRSTSVEKDPVGDTDGLVKESNDNSGEGTKNNSRRASHATATSGSKPIEKPSLKKKVSGNTSNNGSTNNLLSPVQAPPVINLAALVDRARKVNEFSGSDLIQLKLDLVNSGLNLNDYLMKRKGSLNNANSSNKTGDLLPLPLSLKELSILYEVIVVTRSRLESIRYAIHRFGTIEKIDSIPIMSIHYHHLENTINQQSIFFHGESGGTNYDNKIEKEEDGGLISPGRALSPPKSAAGRNNRSFPVSVANPKQRENIASMIMNKETKLINPLPRKPAAGASAVSHFPFERKDSERSDNTSCEASIDEAAGRGTETTGDRDDYEQQQPLSSPSKQPQGDSTSITKVINPLDKIKLYLKTVDLNNPNRILRLVVSENKKICIIPLCKWIYIQEDTLNTLDFLNSFNEETVKKIYLAEEYEPKLDEETELGLSDLFNHSSTGDLKKISGKAKDHPILLQHQRLKEIEEEERRKRRKELIGDDYESDENKGDEEEGEEEEKEPLTLMKINHINQSTIFPNYSEIEKLLQENNLLPSPSLKADGKKGSSGMNTSYSEADLKSSVKKKGFPAITNNNKKVAGFANNKKGGKGSTRDIMMMNTSQSMPELVLPPYEKVQILDILQNELVTKDFKENILQIQDHLITNETHFQHQQQQQQQELEKNNAAISPIMKKTKSQKLVSSSKLSNSNDDGDNRPVSNDKSNGTKQAAQKAMLIDQRLKALNRTASEQLKILNQHDKLLIKESKEMKVCDNLKYPPSKKKGDGASSFLLQTDSNKSLLSDLSGEGGERRKIEGNEMKIISKSASNNHLAASMALPSTSANLRSSFQQELMQERLQVIESLQQIKTPAVNLNNSMGITTSSAMIPSFKSSLTKKVQPSSHRHNKPSHGNSSAASQHVDNTVAGKRLAESLRALSDTLDSQYKKS
jgi:CRP-like cAMP-binding protein